MSTINFKAAVVQASPVLMDKTRTIKKVEKLTAEAAGKGAKLVVFPESFVSAYPRGFGFGMNPEGRKRFMRYFESAIEIPGPEVTQMGLIAKKNGIYLAIGITERECGTLYCTVIFFSPEGEYLGKHRKLVPTENERSWWGRGDASTMPVFDTPLGKIGAVICWENYMPLVRTTMYNKGIQLYIALNADGTDGWQATARHIAMEGRCFVFSANQFIRRSIYTENNVDCFGYAEDPKTIVARGGSTIVSPFGEVLAGPNETEECILIADINLGEVYKGKYDLDVVGHYSRPDIFTLYVDESLRPTVVVRMSKDTEHHQNGGEKVKL